MLIRGMTGCCKRPTSDCGRSWPNFTSQSTRRKAESSTWPKGKASDSWALRFVASAPSGGVWRADYVPKLKTRTALLQTLRDIFRCFQSQPVERLVMLINPILRGWVNYFGVGHSSRCFSFVKDWVEKKMRRHLMRARKRRGFGWDRWSRRWLYDKLGLFNEYRVRRPVPSPHSPPVQ